MPAPLILSIPEDISARAREIAEAVEQPVEQVLLDHLKTLTPLSALPPDEQAELEALSHLSDDALWTIAREQMPEAVENRAHDLMTRNNQGKLNTDEQTELEQLVRRADRLMLRKAEAGSILTQRGYAFTPQDFKAQ